jgi:hypothetical protein
MFNKMVLYIYWLAPHSAQSTRSVAAKVKLYDEMLVPLGGGLVD